jgi:DNA-binding IclR family transcriptional regulator
VFLAFLPSEVVEPFLNAPLAACTEKTITTPDRLRKELETTRQRGYSFDDGEFEDGVRAISAPIRDIGGNVIAAMSIPGPANRLTPERIPELAEALVETANAVSAHILRP